MNGTIRSAAVHERLPALRLLFAHLPEPQQFLRVAGILDQFESGTLDPAGLWIAHNGDQLEAALLCEVLPGAAGLVWPPGGTVDPLDMDALVRTACAWLRWRGCRLLHCLPELSEHERCEALLRNGFVAITELLSLRLDLAGRSWPAADGLRIEPMMAVSPADFATTLQATYESTRDCPEISGWRSLDDILAGLHGSAGANPSLWRVAFDEAGPAGVVLPSTVSPREWEVTYLGVVPRARRRGLARAMLHQVIGEALADGADRLNVAVDSRNEPAVRLYQQLGMNEWERRTVLLAQPDEDRSVRLSPSR